MPPGAAGGGENILDDAEAWGTLNALESTGFSIGAAGIATGGGAGCEEEDKPAVNKCTTLMLAMVLEVCVP